MSSVPRIVLPVVGVTCGLAVTIIWNAFLALELFRRFNLCFDRMAGLAMLSAAYYRHRAEVFRFALLTTSEPVAEGRLRTIVEKYRRLADRADKHSAQGAQEPARSPPFPGMRASEMR